MNDNEDFYQKFNSNSKKNGSFKRNVFVPFISGVLGSALVLGIAFNIPNIKDNLKSDNSFNSTNIESTSNSGTVDYVSLQKYSDTATYAANKVLPSIVGIKVEYTITSNFLQKMSSVGSAEGSGIIISEDGYILTNSHVINTSDYSVYYEISEATKIYVYLYNDETPYEASIVGIDEKTDLAVIKIEKDGLTKAELGDSSSIKIGEFAMAVRKSFRNAK
ncbi:MAG: trypsin-like peptidase domain-containing protein [Clostridia bacterium]|nr:trypsin-like peptidase domain-containing protein [Clostridia bacterium]